MSESLPEPQPPIELLEFRVPLGEEVPSAAEASEASSTFDDVVDDLFTANSESVYQKQHGSAEPWSELQLALLDGSGSLTVRLFALSLVDQMHPGGTPHDMPDKGASIEYFDAAGQSVDESLYNLRDGRLIRIDIDGALAEAADVDDHVIVGRQESQSLADLLRRPDFVALPPSH
jgi:hypothetical protein